MAELLDDQRDLKKTREEKLLSRRNFLRPLNMLFPLFYTAIVVILLPDFRENPSMAIFTFISAYTSLGILGWMVGKALTLFVLKDVSPGIRSKYLVTVSTLVPSTLLLLMTVITLVLTWIWG